MEAFHWGQLGLQLGLLLLTIGTSTIVIVSRLTRVEDKVEELCRRQDRTDTALESKMSKEMCEASHLGFREKVDMAMQQLKLEIQKLCRKVDTLESRRDY